MDSSSALNNALIVPVRGGVSAQHFMEFHSRKKAEPIRVLARSDAAFTRSGLTARRVHGASTVIGANPHSSDHGPDNVVLNSIQAMAQNRDSAESNFDQWIECDGPEVVSDIDDRRRGKDSEVLACSASPGFAQPGMAAAGPDWSLSTV